MAERFRAERARAGKGRCACVPTTIQSGVPNDPRRNWLQARVRYSSPSRAPRCRAHALAREAASAAANAGWAMGAEQKSTRISPSSTMQNSVAAGSSSARAPEVLGAQLPHGDAALGLQGCHHQHPWMRFVRHEHRGLAGEELDAHGIGERRHAHVPHDGAHLAVAHRGDPLEGAAREGVVGGRAGGLARRGHAHVAGEQQALEERHAIVLRHPREARLGLLRQEPVHLPEGDRRQERQREERRQNEQHEEPSRQPRRHEAQEPTHGSNSSAVPRKPPSRARTTSSRLLLLFSCAAVSPSGPTL